jgi:hypothetical protein
MHALKFLSGIRVNLNLETTDLLYKAVRSFEEKFQAVSNQHFNSFPPPP